MGTTRLLWAYGSKDPVNNAIVWNDYHGASKRGAKSVYLFDPQPESENIPNDARNLDLLQDRV